MREQGDGLTCRDCGWHGLPCTGCGGWITRYLGIDENGDSVGECPDCGERYYAAAPRWELEAQRRRQA